MTNEVFSEMSLLGRQKEKIPRHEKMTAHTGQPAVNHEGFVSATDWLPSLSFAQLRVPEGTPTPFRHVSALFPRLSFSASYSWVSSFLEVECEPQGHLSWWSRKKPQFIWLLDPTREGGTVHQGEPGNPSVAPMQERSLCAQCPSQWPPSVPSIPYCCFKP